MNTIQVSEARPDDIGILMQFQQKLASETEGISLDEATLERGMRALFSDPAKGRYYVAREGDSILGCFMTTYEWSDWRNGTVHWLQSVYVREGDRKKGVFKYMFDYLMARIRQDPDARGLRLYVDKSNQRAMRVYESMGMDGSHYTVYERMK